MTDVCLFQLFHENSEIIKKRRMRNSFKSELLHRVQYKGISNVSMLLFEGKSMATVHGSIRLTITLVSGSCNLLYLNNVREYLMYQGFFTRDKVWR